MAKGKKTKPKSKASSSIALRAGLTIGAAAAEDDLSLLLSCFEDSGQYAEVRDVASPKFIIKGRTGSGKTALLHKLKSEAQHVIRIDPNHLCLHHISNSDIIRFLSANEVRIEPFLEIIWKHTFATELLRRRFRIANAADSKSVLSQFLNSVTPTRRRAVEYLRDFGVDIWPEFEERVTAVTKKVEDEITGELGLAELGFPLKIGGSHVATVEQKAEVQRRIQRVLGSNQLSRLQTVIDFMAAEVFQDQKAPYYIIIDDLDQFHVDDTVRLRLLRALIEIVKKFRPISCVKFCIAMRSDLLEEIFEKTRDRGFQEEKYEDNIITLRWTRDQLFRLVERRITETFKRQYEGRASVKFYDIFPEEVQGKPTREFVLDRTLMRPRDAILFVNECLERAVNKVSVSPSNVREAEIAYSQKRFDSLKYEWLSLYPLLPLYVTPIRGKRAHFNPDYFSRSEMVDFALSLAIHTESDHDRLGRLALKMVSGTDKFDEWEFEREWLSHLYKVGVVGLKTQSHSTTMWSYKDKQGVDPVELSSETRIAVHPMLRSSLGVADDPSARAKAKRDS